MAYHALHAAQDPADAALLGEAARQAHTPGHRPDGAGGLLGRP